MLTSTGVYSTGLTDNVGDIIQFAVDMDNGKFYIGQDDTYYHTSGSYNDSNPSNGTNPAATSMDTTLDWRPDFNVGHDSSYGTKFHANFGQDSSFAGNKTAQGNQDSNSIGDFYYTPPTDFLALCTSNLPDPAVIPSEHFNTVLWTGNSSTQSITGVGFQPDLNWTKCRNTARHHWVSDSIRGVDKWLQTSNTDGDGSNSVGLTSFNSDGFTYAYDSGNAKNVSGETYASWNWKANGTGVSNTNGTITSTVSANADAGFSIVSWTGTGSNGTIGHGLSSAPEMVIVKDRDGTGEWTVQHSGAGGGTKYSKLNQSDSFSSNSTFWNDTDPTNTVVTIGSHWWVNTSGNNIITYCFHSVEGYSKVGSYTGNGSTDGTFVYCGFRPAYVMVKRTDSTGDWYVWDSVRNEYNLVTRNLVPNKTNAEFVGTSNYTLDFTSNGFKHRGSGGDVNASGGSYIYLAFAENPFKYTNAR
jgi:hypothetical protein